ESGGMVAYLSDGTRVRLAGLDGHLTAGQLEKRFPPDNMPVVLLCAPGQTGREVTGFLYSAAHAGTAARGPGVYQRMNHGLAAAGYPLAAPLTLRSLGAIQSPEDMVANLRLTGRVFADMAYTMSRGNETLRQRIIDATERHFAPRKGATGIGLLVERALGTQ